MNLICFLSSLSWISVVLASDGLAYCSITSLYFYSFSNFCNQFPFYRHKSFLGEFSSLNTSESSNGYLFRWFPFKVIVKNLESNAQRIAQAVVLDPSLTRECTSDVKQSSSGHVMLVFPSFNFPQKDQQPIHSGTAYLSPLLAFNLDFHLSCLGSLVNKGQETLGSYFQAKVDDSTSGEGTIASVIKVGLKPLIKLPRYASHLRISFVKVPTCGILESLNGKSSIQAENRQEVIDSALQNYFEVERYLARGDIFSVQVKRNCRSTFCIRCNKSSRERSDDIIYFKVDIFILYTL